MSAQEKVVLIVENDAEMVVLLRLILRRRAFKVVAVFSGEKSLAALEELKPDLVLLDLLLPGMDGWEIYQRMQASPALREIPIIVVSARSLVAARLSGQRFDAIAGYVRKPFHPSLLLRLVDDCLNLPSAQT